MSSLQLPQPFVHVKNVFSPSDIEQLKNIYSTHALSTGIPCYAFLNHVGSSLVERIISIVSPYVNQKLFYLNDFFFFTGKNFSTPWHVDTELFVFKYAINVWILLEPSCIDDPLSFVDSVNNPGDLFYQSVEKEDDELIFVDFTTNDVLEMSSAFVDANQVHTPRIAVGDLLLIDPMRFHRTNTFVPKGACVFKFVYSDSDILIREKHLPAAMWPEISLYKNLLRSSSSWENFLLAVSKEIITNGLKSPLISGFYPDNFPYLVDKAASLISNQ